MTLIFALQSGQQVQGSTAAMMLRSQRHGLNSSGRRSHRRALLSLSLKHNAQQSDRRADAFYEANLELLGVQPL